MSENTSSKIEAFCLALYVGLVPLNCLTFAGMGSIYKFLVLGIAAVLVMITIRRGTIEFQPGISMWGLYIAYMCISAFFAENTERSLSYFVGMFQLFLLSLLFLQKSYTDKQHNIIKRMIVLSGIVFVILQIMYSEQQIYTDRQIISFGSLGGIDPNEFCGYLILPIAVCMQVFFERTSSVKKIISIILVGMFLYGIMSSASRGGLLAATVTIAISIIKSGRFSTKKLFYIIGLIIVGNILFMYVIIPNMSDTALYRFSLEGFKSYGGSGRVDIWMETLNMLWDNPFRLMFGCGVFGATSVPYCSHNMIIQVLLDSGIVGLMIYIAFLIKLTKNLKYQDIYIAAAFWGIQTSMLTLSAYAWFKAVWIIYLLCLVKFQTFSETRIKRNDYEEKNIVM